MTTTEAEEALQGKAQIGQCMFGFVDSMALACAVELRIPDIIHSASAPVTLSQIASTINNGDSVNVVLLERMMRLLVNRGIFTAHYDQSTLYYGLTSLSSRLLLSDSEVSMVPMILVLKSLMSSFNYFTERVKGGGTGFKNANGCEVWDYMAQNVELCTLANKASENHCRAILEAVITGYEDGFNNIGSLVDVGGGPGLMAAHIVKSYPHIKAINYDLPHIIKTAPPHDGVSHIEGDMFESIPIADATLLKNILCDWGDEAVIRIFENCRKAIPEKTGKLIIIDYVLQTDGNSPSDHISIQMDLANNVALGGKHRTELEWKKLLEEGGFPTCKIIKIPALQFIAIIEANPC